MRLACMIVFANLALVLQAQEPSFWQVLAEVGFTKSQSALGEIEVPVFSNHLKSYQGKKIKLKGFVIPLSETNAAGKFMFSSLPFNVCYFCGAAGPETIVEVETAQKIKFTSSAIWMEGILFLNEKDPDHHIYILKSAKTIPAP